MSGSFHARFFSYLQVIAMVSLRLIGKYSYRHDPTRSSSLIKDIPQWIVVRPQFSALNKLTCHILTLAAEGAENV